MELSRKQFDVLVALSQAKFSLTQRDLERLTPHSLSTINRTMSELSEAGYVSGGQITNAGLTALEPYRAKRAIFIAAGFGTRLVPITLNTPKPRARQGRAHHRSPDRRLP